MSYVAYMEIDTGKKYPTMVKDMGNYTWNVGVMFLFAFDAAWLMESHETLSYEYFPVESKYKSLYDLNGLTGEVVSPILRRMILHMETREGLYKRLNPQNGWGNYCGAVEYLRDILAGCKAHPKATLSIT